MAFPALMAPRTTSRDLTQIPPPPPWGAAHLSSRKFLEAAAGLEPHTELCVYTVKRIESHIIIYVTEASAISNINEDK